MSKQLQLPGMFKPSKHEIKVICYCCYRVFTIPMGVLIQGDPVCICGSRNITGNHYARLLMAELDAWDFSTPYTTPEDGEGKRTTITAWTANKGATF